MKIKVISSFTVEYTGDEFNALRRVLGQHSISSHMEAGVSEADAEKAFNIFTEMQSAKVGD